MRLLETLLSQPLLQWGNINRKATFTMSFSMCVFGVVHLDAPFLSPHPHMHLLIHVSVCHPLLKMKDAREKTACQYSIVAHNRYSCNPIAVSSHCRCCTPGSLAGMSIRLMLYWTLSCMYFWNATTLNICTEMIV